MKKLIISTVLGIFLSALLIPGIGVANSDIQIDATDTVAGYGTLVRTSNGPANTDLELLLEKPDGSQVLFETKTNSQGTSKIDIAGFYTKKAGDYALYIGDSTDTFQVYADSVSVSRSLMEISEQTATANGNDYVNLKVHLYDRYNNPIEGHTVDILSSRLTDEVVRVSSRPYTNELGTIQFNVYSKEAGVSTFLAHDSTEGMTLNDRAKIAFYEPGSTLNEIGGSIFLASADDPGPVSYLKIEGLEETVALNSSLNFTVTAYDDDGNTATDYTGDVRFSSSDNNSTLPDDYTFEAEDQGSHTFSLSLSFKTEGTQTLTVTDIDQTSVYGEMDVAVSSSGSGSSVSSSDSSSSSSSGEFSISTPLAGTYSSSSVMFTGEADYGLNIQIYDNDELLGETAVTADGEYSKQISGLEDGNHRFRLITTDSSGNQQDTSEEIVISIDTTAPELDQATTDPEGEIPASSPFTITVYTEPDLPEVGIIFSNALYELTEDVSISGMYEGSFRSPSELGEYEIDILLVDEVGNEISYNSEILVTIIEATEETETEDEEEATEEETSDEETEDEELHEAADEEEAEEEIIYYPGQVSGVEAVAGDTVVTLSWQAPETLITETEYEEWLAEQEEEEEEETTEDEEEATEEEEETTEEETEEIELNINHYKIYYGPTPQMMISYVETWDASTTWYVPSLNNDTTYYFSVVAVDEENLESLQKSDAVSGTPESDEEAALAAAALLKAEEEAAAAAEAAALEAAIEEEEIPTETGPEVAWLLLFSIGFTQAYSYARKRKGKIIVPIQDIRA